jgi:hypothetical protein
MVNLEIKVRKYYGAVLLCRIKQQTLKIVNNCLNTNHRHLSNIYCLMVCTAHLVCFISTVNGHSKK